jgi:hypothetical protein
MVRAVAALISLAAGVHAQPTTDVAARPLELVAKVAVSKVVEQSDPLLEEEHAPGISAPPVRFFAS